MKCKNKLHWKMWKDPELEGIVGINTAILMDLIKFFHIKRKNKGLCFYEEKK